MVSEEGPLGQPLLLLKTLTVPRGGHSWPWSARVMQEGMRPMGAGWWAGIAAWIVFPPTGFPPSFPPPQAPCSWPWAAWAWLRVLWPLPLTRGDGTRLIRWSHLRTSMSPTASPGLEAGMPAVYALALLQEEMPFFPHPQGPAFRHRACPAARQGTRPKGHVPARQL